MSTFRRGQNSANLNKLNVIVSTLIFVLILNEMWKNFLALPSKEFCKTVTIFVQSKCECECAYKLKNHTFCRQTSAVSVIYKLQKPHNTRLFTQTVSQPRHREHCGFLHFIQKVLNFILLELMFYLTIMDFTIFRIKVW